MQWEMDATIVVAMVAVTEIEQVQTNSVKSDRIWHYTLFFLKNVWYESNPHILVPGVLLTKWTLLLKNLHKSFVLLQLLLRQPLQPQS